MHLPVFSHLKNKLEKLQAAKSIINFLLSLSVLVFLCFSLLAFVCPEFTWLTRLAQPAAAVCALCHNGSIVKLYKVTPPPPPDKQI